MNAFSKLWNDKLWQGVVEAGLHAPSGDNCQPFSFRQSDSGLSIFHDYSRSRHFMNINHTATYLALGCTIENIVLFLSSFSIAADWELQHPIGEFVGRKLVGTINIRTGGVPDPLASSLSQRATDRRVYQGGDVAHPVFGKLLERQTNFGKSSLSICTPDHKALVRSCMNADRLVWTNKLAHRDLFTWLRLSDAEVEATQDGMPWRTLGINAGEKVMLLLSRNWSVQQLFNGLGGHLATTRVVKNQLRSSAACLLFSTTDCGADSLIELGRFAQRCWIELNQHGFGVQPMSAASLFCFAEAQKILPSLPARQLATIKTYRQIFQDAFTLNSNQVPVWLLRTGISPQLPDNMRCPRLHWKAVVEP